MAGRHVIRLLVASLALASVAWSGDQAPTSGWMLICGTFADTPAGWQARAKAEAANAGPVDVVTTDEYENLTPGLQVLSAGLFASSEAAATAKAKMAAGGVTCYAKKTARRAAAGDELIFVGDDHVLWFCVRRGGTALAYETCKKSLGHGRMLTRPKRFGDTGLGHDVVRVAHAKAADDQSPCGDISEYTGSVERSVRVGNAVAPGELPALTKAVAAYLEKRTKLTFPDLALSNAVRADITGDGVDDVVFSAKAGGSAGMEVTGNVASFVGFVDGRRRVAGVLPIFLHHVAKKAASEDYYAASIYGRLAGLADVNGDGRTDVLVENGYYEGNGMEAFTIVNGRAKSIAGNGCGA